MRAVNTDIIGAILGFAITALFWFNLGNVGMLSAIFPKAIMVLMLIAAGLLLIKGFVRPDVFAPFKDENLGRIAILAIILFTWVFAMRGFGFIVSSIVAFTILTMFLANINKQLNARTVVVCVIVAIVEVIVLYLIFTRILYVPLPKGMFI